MKRMLQLVILILGVFTTPLMLQAAPCGICREDITRDEDVVRLQCCPQTWHASCLIGWDDARSGTTSCPACSQSLRERGESDAMRLFERMRAVPVDGEPYFEPERLPPVRELVKTMILTLGAISPIALYWYMFQG